MNAIVEKVLGEYFYHPTPEEEAAQAAQTPVQSVTGQAPPAEERTEVHIGQEILRAVNQMLPMARRDRNVAEIERLANELIQMHERQP